MGYKTISLSDEAYSKLASLKRKGESFTDVIFRLCSKATKKPLASFAGAWIMSDEEEKKIFGEISELWRKYEESLLRHRFSSSVIEKKSRSRQEG
ncbi:antitoxin [Candidatus Bathyarchaeota archaeon]|nr:MAG: antitoxin [Candidatus Bathyarchaeota archaeon]